MQHSFLQDRESEADWQPEVLELPLVEPWPRPLHADDHRDRRARVGAAWISRHRDRPRLRRLLSPSAVFFDVWVNGPASSSKNNPSTRAELLPAYRSAASRSRKSRARSSSPVRGCVSGAGSIRTPPYAASPSCSRSAPASRWRRIVRPTKRSCARSVSRRRAGAGSGGGVERIDAGAAAVARRRRAAAAGVAGAAADRSRSGDARPRCAARAGGGAAPGRRGALSPVGRLAPADGSRARGAGAPPRRRRRRPGRSPTGRTKRRRRRSSTRPGVRSRAASPKARCASSRPLRIGIGVVAGLLLGWMFAQPYAHRAERRVAELRAAGRRRTLPPCRRSASSACATRSRRRTTPSSNGAIGMAMIWVLVGGAAFARLVARDVDATAVCSR